jgi:hypothetical protein
MRFERQIILTTGLQPFLCDILAQNVDLSFLFGLFVCFGFLWFLVFGVLFSKDRVSLCSPGYPGTHSLDQAGLELREPPTSVS